MEAARLSGAFRCAFTVTFLVATIAGVVNADSPAGEDRLGQLPDALRAKVESGSDLVSDGVGLVESGSGFVEIDLVPFPAETEVRAVLLYWNGFHSQADLGETDLINIQDTANDGSKVCDGTAVECDSDSECLNAGETGPCNVTPPTPVGAVIEVTGQRIGGPTFFFNLNSVPNNSSTYRADVTDILMGGLVEVGVFNQVLISVNGEGFNQANNGATLVVVLKEPGIDAQVRLQDGQDVAFCGFPGDRQVTQPVVYDDLVAVNLERFLEATFVAGSVEGEASGFDPLLRPNEIEVTVDALDPNVFYEPFASMSGDEWDNVCNTDVACQDVVGDLETLSLPPNETMVTVQAFSRDSMVCSEMPTQTCTTDADCAGDSNVCAFRGEGAASACDLSIEQRPASLVWMVSAISVEEECVLQLDKQISCDGGETWIDVTDEDDPGGESTERCIGWNGLPPGEEEVVVRYLATSSVVGDLDLFDCVLTDPGILPGAESIGTIPGDAVNAEILRTDARECSSVEGQPEEATLVCTCYDPGSGVTREDSDAAGVECQTPGLSLDKECLRRDEQGNNAISLLVTNTGTASLTDCQVTDPLVNDPAFPPAPFDLMPAESVPILTYVSGLDAATLNVASVTCTIVGTVTDARPEGKSITAVDEDECEVPFCGDGMLDPGEKCDYSDPNDPNQAICREDCTYCGDGMLDPEEACDGTDPNDPNAGICRETCTYCGDGMKDPEEVCDPTDPNDPNADICRDTCTYCGDGMLDPEEACDPTDPNDPNADICRDTCTYCGDGMLDPEEACDPTDPNDPNADICRDTCTYCGDGMLDPEEACDPTDPNDPNADICRDTCTYCGDGMLDPEEVCDPTDPNDPNAGICRDTCTYCGDGMLDPEEACDPTDPNDPNAGICRDTCTYCGDGMRDPEEACDPTDPNDPNADICRDTCTYCGDGMRDPEEVCDPTDSNDPNAGICRDTCTYCGDGMRDPEEVCDPTDPNDPNAGICRDTCTYCGDGMRDPEEVCDPTDPNDPNAGICRDTCTYCGDGMLDPEEACDGTDPNDPNADICRDTCTYCGDGMLDPEEACDGTDPNDPNAGICRDTCTYCGDGMLDPEEACDGTDPNDPNADICRDTCTYCGDGMLDPEEACDPTDPNDPNADICRETCTYCGDGMLDPEEACDPTDPNDPNADICRDTCTYCGDGMKDPEEECDPTDPSDPNAEECTEDCRLMPCELEVMKTCFVPGDGDDDDDDDDDCDGKVLAMKLEYTGDGCSVLTNPQSGKAGCTGSVDGAEPVSITITDNRNDTVYGEDVVVLLGDIVEASAAYAGVDKFGSQTDVWIDDGLEEVTFHTSCSQPLQVGDQFGSMRLVELTTTNGGVVTLPDADPDIVDGQKTCVISPVPPKPHCEGKIKVLTLRYVGGSCDDSMQDQGDKFSCQGDADGIQPVRVVCEDYLDTGDPATVALGDLVEIAAANAGDTTLGSQTDCALYDEFGNWVQDLSFHTSCSKPLNLGDRFGSLEVFSLDTTDNGFQGMGQNVLYTYAITNNSDAGAVNVTVEDDQLGTVPGSPIDSIPPYGTVILQANALISEDTTNVVTVEGELETGQECPAVEDFSTVIVEEPPPDPIECTTKIKAMLLTYIGPPVAGPVSVEIVGRSGATAVHEFPGGLATGTTVSSAAENGFTIDAGADGETDLGSKTTLSINGIPEVIHTSCSTPFVAGLPAPLDSPKGDPSPNWFVETFTQKN